jgi:uncharacterized protein
MVLAALFGSLVGLALGLTGGGGSILAVPLLVYGLGFEFRQAVALSLAIVGLTALYGAFLQRSHGHVAWGQGLLVGLGGAFAVPGGVLVGEQLSERTSLILFAVLMGYIGGKMLFSRKSVRTPYWLRCGTAEGAIVLCPSCICKLLIAGGITGTLSGLFGVGGGFLLVPALMAVAGVSIEYATATSLVSIVIISGAGAISNANQLVGVPFLIPITFLVGSGVGMRVGVRVKQLCSPKVLRMLFGIAVLLMAAFVLLRNLG